MANNCNDLQMKPKQCMYCDFTCQYETQLKKHLEEVHGRNLIFPCHICSKQYTDKVSLKYHLTHTHEGKKKAGQYISTKISA